jgi:hypothetical protein
LDGLYWKPNKKGDDVMRNKKAPIKTETRKDKPWDMYAVKEHPLAQVKRINGARYEKDMFPLKTRMAYLAADSDKKAVKFIESMSSIGFSFNLIGKYDFEVVCL